MHLTAGSSHSYGWVESSRMQGSGSSCANEKAVHTSGYRLLSFSGVTSTPLLAKVATLVMASTSFISENTLAAAEATAITYTVFTSLYTTRYLPSRALSQRQGMGERMKGQLKRMTAVMPAGKIVLD